MECSSHSGISSGISKKINFNSSGISRKIKILRNMLGMGKSSFFPHLMEHS